jgi:hypothetical protein
MCECVVAIIIITIYGANEFSFLYFDLWLYRETQSIPCLTADVNPSNYNPYSILPHTQKTSMSDLASSYFNT